LRSRHRAVGRALSRTRLRLRARAAREASGIGQIIGSLASGPVDRLVGSYKLPVLIGAVATAASLGYLALVGTLPPTELALWFAVFGFVSAFGPLAIGHAKSLCAPHQVGRGLTVFNMG